MKTIKTTGALRTAFRGVMVSALVFAGCSDRFLEEKKMYTGGSWEIFDNATLAQLKVNSLYNQLMPEAGSGESATHPGWGGSDNQSMSTEEFGTGNNSNDNTARWINPNVVITNATVAGFMEKARWTIIREANMILKGLDGSTLTEAEKKPLYGQVYYWRAFAYYHMFLWYGGVPVVTTPLDPVIGGGDGSHLETNRSTTAETFKFIGDDLDKAIDMLPDAWPAAQYACVTKAAAAAMKGRLYLLYASPLFNRADDQARWNAAYTACKEAYDTALAGGRELVKSAADTQAKAWGEMFTRHDTKEGIFFTLYNNSTSDQLRKYSSIENNLRPNAQAYSGRGSGILATDLMVDLFPMKDGKRPEESSIGYDPLKFFVDRDPRFYRTFAFPGTMWPYGAQPAMTYWNYAWYTSEERMDDPKQTGNAAGSYVSVYNSSVNVRKRSSNSATYSADFAFQHTTTPLISIRMGEVVLNLAEAAAGAGKLPEGYNYLKMIRERAYGADPGDDYGLKGADASRQSLLKAILYERQIELAYEGFRFHDMRRWFLWEGGTSASRTATDFTFVPWAKGSTLEYLGVEGLNGKRRHGVQVYYPAVVSGTGAANDPLAGKRPAAGLNPDAPAVDFAEQMTDLSAFYDNLERKEMDNLDHSDDRLIRYDPYYYIIGVNDSALKNMPYLWQTIGWLFPAGGETNQGRFDPFSDKLPELPQDEGLEKL